MALDRAAPRRRWRRRSAEQALARLGGRATRQRAGSRCATWRRSARLLAEDTEIAGILRALDGRFMRPAPGGDLLRTPEILPTGRNLHGFDPFRIPSAFAVQDGAQPGAAAARPPRWPMAMPCRNPIAMVLWGTDNLKTEGAPIGQALALIGARPRFDSYGRARRRRR
jgi:magnesium chelatase subunit H